MRCCTSLFATGKAVVMDSGFAVHDVLPRLKERGVFALIMVEKHGSWPKGIFGNKIKQHMENKPVGTFGCLPGTKDGQKFNIWMLKEPNYVSMLM